MSTRPGRIDESIGERQRSRQLFIRDIGAGIEARLHEWREAIADVRVELLIPASVVLSEAVAVVHGERSDEIERPRDAQLLAVAALDEHAGRIFELVTQGEGISVSYRTAHRRKPRIRLSDSASVAGRSRFAR